MAKTEFKTFKLALTRELNKCINYNQLHTTISDFYNKMDELVTEEEFLEWIESKQDSTPKENSHLETILGKLPLEDDMDNYY